MVIRDNGQSQSTGYYFEVFLSRLYYKIHIFLEKDRLIDYLNLLRAIFLTLNQLPIKSMAPSS